MYFESSREFLRQIGCRRYFGTVADGALLPETILVLKLQSCRYAGGASSLCPVRHRRHDHFARSALDGVEESLVAVERDSLTFALEPDSLAQCEFAGPLPALRQHRSPVHDDRPGMPLAREIVARHARRSAYTRRRARASESRQ